MLAELFDEGCEGGGWPAFLGATAAGVDGDAPDAGRFQSMFGGYKWQFIGHFDVLKSCCFRQVCNDVSVLTIWWPSRCDYYSLDASKQQVMLYQAIRVA